MFLRNNSNKIQKYNFSKPIAHQLLITDKSCKNISLFHENDINKIKFQISNRSGRFIHL